MRTTCRVRFVFRPSGGVTLSALVLGTATIKAPVISITQHREIMLELTLVT